MAAFNTRNTIAELQKMPPSAPIPNTSLASLDTIVYTLAIDKIFGGTKMIQTAKTQLIYWSCVALLFITLTISVLILTTNSRATLFETSGLSSQPAAVLACQGPGGGSNGSSGYC